MTIGERIKLKRVEKGWSQRDLSAKMKYSNHSTIARIESGTVDIPQSRIVQFAEVLGTTVAYLMGWEENREEKSITDDGLTEGQKKLIEFAKSVPEDKADLILRVMKSILEDS